MIIKHAVVKNQIGLRARPATLFVEVAKRYKTPIFLRVGEKKVNAKSLLGVLSCSTLGNTDIEIIATEESSDDAEAACNALVRLVESDFTEY